MTPSDYVQWLISANATQLKLVDDSDFGTESLMAAFGFGALEEWHEFVNATAAEQPKEAGDYLAYYVLLSVSLGFSRSHVSERLDKVAYNRILQAPVQDLAGALKRLFRGDGSTSAVEGLAYNLLCFVLGHSSLTFEAVAELNKQKLTDRLERLGTFHGSGDNR